jgi:alkanesulfonate monooxygenase SsuD/methylene tetrahydromethanopterin reductase-like flavin-dependent oxidoreductase (luciferase family)
MIRDFALKADTGGMDSIWLSDHLFYRFDPDPTYGPWECWTLLSALAEATNNVELGTMVLCSPFRNPALLAKMAHTFDEISGGRLILGVGAGWHQPEFDAFGYPFSRLVDQFEETLQILRPLLKEGSVDFVGTHHQASNCVITPLGPRPEGIPLLVGATGPRMLQLTARYADMWNKAWLGDTHTYEEHLANMKQACEQEGRDPSSLGMTASVSVTFPELGEPSPFAEDPVTGSIETLAQALRRYSDLGTSHLIVQVTPWTLESLDRFIEVVDFFRRQA